jgi:hypothetical protein
MLGARIEEIKSRLLVLAYDCEDGSIEPDYTKPLFGLYTDVLTW